MYGFDKPMPERFLHDDEELSHLRFRQELLQGPAGGRSHHREDAGLDLAGPVDDPHHLWHLHPARHRQGARATGRRSISGPAPSIIVGSAIPGFLFAILLIVLFAGGTYFDVFPLRGHRLRRLGRAVLAGTYRRLFLAYGAADSRPGRSAALPASALLTKNSFLDQINLQYVTTARAKGLSEQRVLYGHVFRNAMLIVIAGFPSAFVGILFTGALLIEIIFSLDGLGLLGWEAAHQPRLSGDVRDPLHVRRCWAC